jgi:hypothetical protein
MNIKAKFIYARKSEVLVTIIGVYNSSDGIMVIFVGEDGMIRHGSAEYFEVIDDFYLPKK